MTVPVVGTPTGAIPDLVAPSAGVLVPPGDARALSAALAQVLADAHVREQLTHGARRVRDRLPSWEDASVRMSEALEGVGRRRPGGGLG